MELRKWPRRNDPESIRARQDALAGLTDAPVFAHDLTPFAGATEALTGVSMVPTAVVGPIDMELGEYAGEEPAGAVVEERRRKEAIHVPLANPEGGLAISLYRGARAVGESGGLRTHVLRDRMTRASAFIFEGAGQAAAFARWIEGQVPAMRDWLAGAQVEGLSRYARL